MQDVEDREIVEDSKRGCVVWKNGKAKTSLASLRLVSDSE